MLLTKLSLAGNNYIIPRQGKSLTFFNSDTEVRYVPVQPTVHNYGKKTSKNLTRIPGTTSQRQLRQELVSEQNKKPIY
jgi:hypothetical protein